jgi:hypothetical protein
MVARRPFKLPGLREYLEEVTQVTAETAAKEIVADLIFLSPWYSGHFANNWEVRVGDTRIPADNPPPPYEQRRERTTRQQPTIPPVPSLRGTGSKKVVGYTIGNRSTYRNIAMDLEPGRTDKATTISAPQDWYVSYAQGTLQTRLGKSVSKAANNPRIKGFKSYTQFGPVGRLVNQ